jgi:hypothetical protein
MNLKEERFILAQCFERDQFMVGWLQCFLVSQNIMSGNLWCLPCACWESRPGEGVEKEKRRKREGEKIHPSKVHPQCSQAPPLKSPSAMNSSVS